MRSLLLHANLFESKITMTSNRPIGIIPEDGVDPVKRMEECLLVLFCVEPQDTNLQVEQLHDEIVKNAKELNVERIMLGPFVHLAKTVADPETAKKRYFQLKAMFLTSPFAVDSSHFGYGKTFLMDIKGHRRAYSYREF
ncbi:hypothetical protein HYU19_00425 [Candidatus Woesearchaeota archaeon]|nr:hypothetical protein [Candidatus Woesearchaeota archaeon]